jgi:FKBP-type peptidyl-prolyl cis-trans isomerase
MKSPALLAIICLALFFAGCGSGGEKPSTSATGGKPEARSGLTKLGIIDEKTGTGPAAEEGDLVIVNYTGKFKNGKVFDTNKEEDKDPFAVIVGQGMVIKGWDQGLVGVRAGGVRKLEVPYDLAYGEQANGDIPPKSDLYFDIEVLDVVKKADMDVVENTDVKVGSGPVATTGKKVTVQIKESLPGGKVVEDSRTRGGPYKFTLGAHEAQTWVEAAIEGMKAGGVRKSRVNPNAAWGAPGRPPKIPGNMVLHYDIELLKVE